MATASGTDPDPVPLSPMAARAIRNALAAGVDPHRVAVALGVDPQAVERLLASAPEPSPAPGG